MKQYIKELIDTLEYNCKSSQIISEEILRDSDDYFAKHKASALKFKSEDSIRLLAALKQLIEKPSNSNKLPKKHYLNRNIPIPKSTNKNNKVKKQKGESFFESWDKVIKKM